MTDQNTTHTVTYEFIVKAEDAISKAQAFRTQVDQIKTQLMQMASSTGQPIKDLAEGLRRAGEVRMTGAIEDIKRLGLIHNETKQQIVAAVDAEKQKFAEYTQALSTAKSETSTSTSKMGGSFLGLAAGIGAALGISAIGLVKQFFSDFISYVSQATELAYGFAKSLFEMQTAINSMRRQGLDITFGEWNKTLQKVHDEFGIFSQTDLMKGSATLLLYGRQAGLTKDQLEKLTEITATFATVTGKSFEDVSKAIGIAISTGNIRGLYSLGIAFSKSEESAMAAALGFGNSFNKLTDYQKGLVVFTLIQEKSNSLADDATQYQKTLAGQYDVTASTIIDVNRKTGESLLGVKLLLEQLKLVWADFVKWIVDNSIVIEFLKEVEDVIQKSKDPEKLKALGTPGGKTTEMAYLLEPFNQIGKAADDGTIKIKNFWDAFNEANKRANEWNTWAANSKLYPSAAGTTNLPEAALGTQTEELSQEQLDALGSAQDKLTQLEADSVTQREDLAIDEQRDLAKIEADGEDKLEKLAADHAQRMLDISRKANDDITTQQDKYDLDVIQAQEAYQNQLADLADKHNDQQIKIEEDFQEKLRELRESFIMNLEDALEKRDARSVLKLIRAYNVDKGQLDRNHAQQQADEERNYKQELAAQERQEALRLRKLKEDLDLRISEIKRARDKELALETESYGHKRAEQITQNAKDLADRRVKYQQDMDDLNRHLLEQEEAIAKSLADQGIITQKGMDNVYDILYASLGPGGRFEAVYDYYHAYALAALSITPGTPPETRYTNPNQPGFARGGVAYANHATSATFGEGGPELAFFMPLSKGIQGSSPQIPAAATNRPSDIGQLSLELSKSNKSVNGEITITLSEGLRGEIVNQALDSAATIILRTTKGN